LALFLASSWRFSLGHVESFTEINAPIGHDHVGEVADAQGMDRGSSASLSIAAAVLARRAVSARFLAPIHA
jgi:hypothetical protein